MHILNLGLNPRQETYRKVLARELPSDRLYGIIEMQRLGYDITIKGIRPNGILKNCINWLNNKLNLNIPDFKIILSLRNYDVIVVQAPYSTLTTIACCILNKKVVYLDSLFVLPKNILRKMIIRFNLLLSDVTIVNSKSQMEECAKYYKVPTSRFKLIPFGIDVSFCKHTNNNNTNIKPFILSVGRDAARDYKTLVEAIKGTEINLIIVTEPYLLADVDLNNHRIEVLNNLTYQELYRLYSESLFVVIPLKKWGTAHSSGITSLLEAKTLGKGVIASYSKPLLGYLKEGDGVYYVEPENVSELRKAIQRLYVNFDECKRLGKNGQEFVINNYSMESFARKFGNYLSSLFNE